MQTSNSRVVVSCLSDSLTKMQQSAKNVETLSSILEVLKGKELGMCCAPNCPNGFNYRRLLTRKTRYREPPKDFVLQEEYCTMFPVPTNPIRLKIWINFFKKKGVVDPVFKRREMICSAHFQMDDMFVKPYTSSKLNSDGKFEIQKKYFTYLKPEALPVYLFGKPKSLQPSKRKPPKQRPPPLLPHEKEALKSAPTEELDEFEAVDMVTPTGSPIMFDVGSPIAVPLMDDNVLVVLQSDSSVDPLSETSTSANALKPDAPSTSGIGNTSIPVISHSKSLNSVVSAADDSPIQVEDADASSSSFQFDHNYTCKEEITIEEHDSTVVEVSSDENDSDMRHNTATKLDTIQEPRTDTRQTKTELVFQRDDEFISVTTGENCAQGNEMRLRKSHNVPIPFQLCVPPVVNSTLLKLAEKQSAEKRPAPIWNPDSSSPTKSALPETEPPNKKSAVESSIVKSIVTLIPTMNPVNTVKSTVTTTPTTIPVTIFKTNASFTATPGSSTKPKTTHWYSTNPAMPIVTATISTVENETANSDFTYETFVADCDKVKLPSCQWALQKHVDGKFISFTYVDVHQSGNLSEKRIVFKGNLTPAIWLDGIFKDHFIFDTMQTFVDVQKMIDKLDKMAPCPGTENPSQPYSVVCDVYRVLRKKRCDPCRRRIANLCSRDVNRKKRVNDKLKNAQENPEGNTDGESAATSEANKEADKDKTQNLLKAIVQAANAELLAQQQELLAIVNPIVIGDDAAKSDVNPEGSSSITVKT